MSLFAAWNRMKRNRKITNPTQIYFYQKITRNEQYELYGFCMIA